MRKLAILTFVTLDGVMQAPKLPEEDTSNGFQYGGWAEKYWEEVMSSVAQHAMNKPYDVLLGRKTYELFNEHNAVNPNSPFHDLTKYVVTNSLSELTWKNSVPISGHVADEIRKLKEKDGPLLQIHGSWELTQALIKNNLVDEFRIWTFPIILGKGKRLFSDEDFPNDLNLITSETTANGVIMSIYSPKKDEILH